MHYTIKFMFYANKNKVSQFSLFSPLQKSPDKSNKANEIFRQLLVKFKRLNSWLTGKIFSPFQQLINISPLWPYIRHLFSLWEPTAERCFFLFKHFPCSQVLALNSNKMELINTSIYTRVHTHINGMMQYLCWTVPESIMISEPSLTELSCLARKQI